MTSHPRHKSGQVKDITSLTNPIIKNLRQLTLKKYRDRDGLFLAEGLKLILDAFDQGWEIDTLIFAKSSLGNTSVERVAARAKAAGGLVITTSNKIISSITRRDNPQMVAGIFRQRWHQLDQLQPTASELYVALDRVRDPGNLGTIIRTCDAVGVRGLVLVGETTDPYSLECVRATMGSIFAVPLFRARQEAFLDWRRSFQGKMIGTHLQGAQDYRQIDYAQGPLLLLMGNEQQGLDEALAQNCDILARIPQQGGADSLNLAVATGVMLYEMRRDVL